MTPLPARLLLATALALSAAAGQAATLGLSAGAPVITGTGDVLYVPGTDLAFVGSDADGLDISAVAALDVSGDLIPGVDPGALLVDAALSATVAAAGFEIDGGTDGGDVIELLLEVGDGDLGATLGAQALAVLTGEFGTTDAFAASDFASPASIAISPLTSATPVPIPAGGLLLVSGLVVLSRRRRASRAS